MRYSFIVYPEAEEKLKQHGLTERIERCLKRPAKGLGRTSAKGLISALEYKFSGYEKDLRDFKEDLARKPE